MGGCFCQKPVAISCALDIDSVKLEGVANFKTPTDRPDRTREQPPLTETNADRQPDPPVHRFRIAKHDLPVAIFFPDTNLFHFEPQSNIGGDDTTGCPIHQFLPFQDFHNHWVPRVKS